MGAITWEPPFQFYLMTPDASHFGKQANHHIFSLPFPSWGCCCCPSKDTNGLVTPLHAASYCDMGVITWQPHFLSYDPRCKLFWQASQVLLTVVTPSPREVGIFILRQLNQRYVYRFKFQPIKWLDLLDWPIRRPYSKIWFSYFIAIILIKVILFKVIFLLPMVRTTSYGSETIKYRGQRLWLSLPQHIRNAQSINEFKKGIKSWNGTDCTCRLCRIFIPQLRFLWYNDTPESEFRILNWSDFYDTMFFNSALKFYTMYFISSLFNHVYIFIRCINFSSCLGLACIVLFLIFTVHSYVSANFK